MKNTKLITMALAGILFFACTKDKEVEKYQQEAGGEETHSAVHISFPKTMTFRSVDANAANDLESMVTTVAVYIVDDISGFMHKGIFNSSQFTQSGDNYLLNSAIKTTTGSKKIYVVLNPGMTLQNQIEARRGAVFGENAIEGTSDALFVTVNDVVMSSLASTSTVLTMKTEAEALVSPLAISVQRNTAKVSVKEKNISTPVIGGTVSNLEFALVVEAKMSYLIQQGGNTLTTVKTPGQQITTLTAENEYFTKLAAPTRWKTVNASTSSNKELNGYYAMENVNTRNMTGNTSAAIIKAQFTPTANTVVISYEANGNRTLGTIPSGTSFYVKKSDNTFWSESAYVSALANGFTSDHFSKKYENGLGYFRIWVQDNEGKRGVLRNNYYVLNITKISGPGLPYVPGVDPDDDTNPEDPNQLIEEDTFISVEVTILPWNVESSDHEL